ncbi:MAG TPA: MFS transporter, partial [Gammaproteobacteria bacterium]|nr:MFS transporter [Gammaproteobacteria bacterium]
MVGWAVGTFWMGKLFDRFGIQLPILIGVVGFGTGFVISAHASNIWMFAAANGILIGMLGISSLFAPLMADVSHWFDRRRGIA